MEAETFIQAVREYLSSEGADIDAKAILQQATAYETDETAVLDTIRSSFKDNPTQNGDRVNVSAAELISVLSESEKQARYLQAIAARLLLFITDRIDEGRATEATAEIQNITKRYLM